MILIAPWARITTDGLPSPKNYPFWEQVVSGLTKFGFETHQISVAGEPNVPGITKRSDYLKIAEIEDLLRGCQTWVSIDSFLPHLAWSVGKPGVAIFGLSDPVIFGHPENINLLKGRQYLREKQFWWWSQCKPNPDAFVGSQKVIDAVLTQIQVVGQYKPH